MRLAPIARAAVLALLALACAGTPSDEPGRGGARRFRLPEPPLEAGRPDYVVVVSVAGLTAGAYREKDGRLLMPTVASLARSGVSADSVEAVAPATKYPAHATILTGQRPSDHGITADLRLGDRGVRATRYWHASHLRAPTLWQRASEKGRLVAALGWPSTVGASIALLLPDIVPTRRGETWLGVLDDSATPAVLAMARRAGGEAPEAGYPGPARDAVLVSIACEIITSPTPPGLLLVHLSQTEGALAARGPDSAEARDAFARVDTDIARLLACFSDAGVLGQTAFVVVGDHGVTPVHTLIAPNTVLAQRRLLQPDVETGRGVASWRAFARSNGGSAFVYARDEKAALSAQRALKAVAKETGAFRIVSVDEIIRLGADPNAWFGLEASPGYQFADVVQGELLSAAATRGGAGYLPGRAEMNAGFVAWGRGIRDGVRIPRMRQTDVAPTLAQLMGLELGETEGRPVVGALR